MRCSRARRWMSPYLDGELSPDRRAALEAHCAGCAGCAGELALQVDAWAVLASVPCPPAPARLWSRVASAASARSRSPGLLEHLRFRLVFGGALAFGTALGVAVGVLLARGPVAWPPGDASMAIPRVLVTEAFGDGSPVSLAGLLPEEPGRSSR